MMAVIIIIIIIIIITLSDDLRAFSWFPRNVYVDASAKGLKSRPLNLWQYALTLTSDFFLFFQCHRATDTQLSMVVKKIL